MPIRTQSDLPAKEILERENIFRYGRGQGDAIRISVRFRLRF